VTGTVFKTSAGAALRIPVIRIGNMAQTLQLLKDAKFWIYGVVQDGATPLFDYVHDTPAVFVVGNEGSGVRDLTIKNCDVTINIPMHGDVESLNVATSAALVMYEVVRKRGSK
jgi:23S rRNA (guanosine2251-2'-O)-methyltransferase